MRAEPDIAPLKPPREDATDPALAVATVRPEQSRWRRYVVIVAVFIAGVFLYSWFGADKVPASKPLFATVDVGDIENAVTAAGTLQPSQFVDVGAQVSGQLERLFVNVGDVVQAGDLVAEIDATVQINRVEASRASLRALEAQLSAREASLQLAEANAERQTRLMREDATSQQDFDSAINSLAAARSSLVQLQSNIAQSSASLASDEATLGFSKIYAPISGTVVTIAMKEGMTLNASQQAPVIMRIADLTTMTVQAEVSEADVGKLTAGMDAYFTTLGSGNRRWYGRLRQILPTPVIENNVVLYTALFDVDNADKALLSEMTAQIFFVTAAARDVLKVPVGALRFSGSRGDGQGSAEVDVVVGPGDVTETRQIRVGVTSRIAAEVLSGLEAGDRVVAGVIEAAPETDQRNSRRSLFR